MRGLIKNAAIALLLLGVPLAACAPGTRGALPPFAERHAMPVADVQAGLTRLGFRPGPVDGVYGPRTRTAVMDYQRLRGLRVTGEIDAAFARRLDAELAGLPPRPSPADTRLARLPDAGAPLPGAVPAPDPGTSGAVPDGAVTDPATPAVDVPDRPAQGTVYRRSEHDPSLVAATETRAEQLGDVRYAEVDLDGDGDLDVIWNNSSALYCGTAGCSFDIYFREGTGWRPVARLLAFEVDVAAGRTRGVRDILVTGRRGSALWQWNGRHYAPAS